MSLPADLKYSKSHEWLRLTGESVATVGITDYAQNSLGDITFVQLPKVGATFKTGEVFGVVESVKAASDLYSPISGTVIAINDVLNTSPETVNREPYAGGWIMKLKVSDASAAASLLSDADYGKLIG